MKVFVALEHTSLSPGERLVARLQLHNDGNQESSFDWCTAHLTGAVFVNPTHALLPPAPQIINPKSGRIASKNQPDAGVLGDNSWCMFATDPVMVANELKLQAGEEKHYIVSAKLPPRLPPSHRGTAMRITYMLVISVQVSKLRTETTRVPFVVRNVIDPPEKHDLIFHAELSHNFDFNVLAVTSGERGSGVGAIMSEQELLADDDIADARAGAFNISRGENRVVIFSLMRSSLRLGQPVVGTLDFSSSSIPCHQVAYFLIGEEFVNDSCRPSLPPPSSTEKPAGGKSGVVRHVMGEGNEVTSFCLHTNFILNIPEDASPCFNFPIVSFRWLLKLEFTIDADSEGRTETLIWETPLNVFAAARSR